MRDAPWAGDACSLVDAFRAGERSPVEELDATLAAIEAGDLNCFSFLDAERRARRGGARRRVAAVRRRAGRIKELEPVEGWPSTEASLVFADRVADYTSHGRCAASLEPGGAVPVGQTTASEFGGLNVSVTKLNGVTHNPWQRGRTVGGSSGGSRGRGRGWAASPLATGGDGGGSIRIPAGYTGLLGMKGTFGRIPRGPHAYMRPEHGRARQPRPLRSRRGSLLRRLRGLRPVRPDEPAGARRLGSGLGTHDLTGKRRRGRSRPRRCDARGRASRSASAPRPRSSSRRRAWSRSTSTSSCRTSRRSG